jgi:hypothetical protein
MRRVIVALASATVLALGVAAPAAAVHHGNGNSYGNGINVHCDASYGQLVKAAKQSGHVEGPVSGAKNFVESGLLAAHCIDGD